MQARLVILGAIALCGNLAADDPPDRRRGETPPLNEPYCPYTN